MQNIKLGTYLHYKGTKVEVIGTALHSETLEEMVVYNHPDPIKGKEANTMWVRPKKMFLEKVLLKGKDIPRFKFLNSPIEPKKQSLNVKTPSRCLGLVPSN